MTISFGVLSTYPPTQCGLATYSASLVEALIAEGEQVGVVSVVDAKLPAQPPVVIHEWIRGQSGGARAAATALNTMDLVILEHEFGIFGGPNGVEVLELLRDVHVPIITVMHTVLVTPTDAQRVIVKALLRGSAHVVVMTRTARQRLIDHYRADPAHVVVIPHGAPDTRRFVQSTPMPVFKAQPVVLTWGLLGRGKGIEWGIEAMKLLKGFHPTPKYQIVGQTHPKVVEREGEAYRKYLQQLVQKWGLAEHVSFNPQYLETPALFLLAAQADIVLLPYDSVEQVTSGVLVEAVTVGKPVVSTGFPHAVELLSSGAGLLVARQDPAAIADAIWRIISEPGLARSMAAESRRIAPELLWSAVARQYQQLAAAVIAAQHQIAVSA